MCSEAGGVVEREKARSRKTTGSKLGVKALHYLWAPGIYHSDPSVKRLQHMSAAWYAIHFLRNGLQSGAMLVV